MARQIYNRTEILNMGRDPVHRWRHSRFKGGEKMGNIAKDDGVRIVEIRRSIHAVEMYDAMYNAPTLEANEVRAMNDLLQLEEEALRGMLVAMRPEEGKRGKVKSVADHDTRARAIELINARLQLILDKRAQKGNVTSVSVATQTAVSVQTSEGAASFERTLRDIQAKRPQLIAAETAALPPTVQTLDILDDESEREPVDASRS